MADIPGKRLEIYGETKLYRKKFEGVMFRGLVLPNKIDLSGKIFLHPVYLDAMPNSVVEALCAGALVICGSQGGTKEIVKSSECVIIDKRWNFSPVDLNKPPKLNIEAWAKTMEMLNSVDINVDNSHVDIETIADQYAEFLYEVVRD